MPRGQVQSSSSDTAPEQYARTLEVLWADHTEVYDKALFVDLCSDLQSRSRQSPLEPAQNKLNPAHRFALSCDSLSRALCEKDNNTQDASGLCCCTRAAADSNQR